MFNAMIVPYLYVKIINKFFHHSIPFPDMREAAKEFRKHYCQLNTFIMQTIT